MKVLYCEDDQTSLKVFRDLTKAYDKENKTTTEVCCFTAPSFVVSELEKDTRFDAFFLDIELPVMDGFELATLIRKKNPEVPIVFISAYSTYVQEGYKLGIFRYISKPLTKEELFPCLDHFLLKKPKIDRNVFRYRDSEGDFVSDSIAFSDITRVSYTNHKIILHTLNQAVHLSVRSSFQDFLRDPLQNHFIQCSQNEAVNPQFLEKYTNNTLFMQNGDSVRISRGFREKLLETLQKHFMENSL